MRSTGSDANGNAGGSTARDADANAVSSARRFRTLSLGFQDGLADWNLTEIGSSPQGCGTVTEGSATLREGDSFLVALDKEVTIPQQPLTVSFTYEAFFDTSDPDAINDAFEAALVDGAGEPLVYTFTSERDAFFNVTEDMPSALGRGTVEDALETGHEVSLDISHLTAGTEATLVFRLVNNDADEETTVRISEVEIRSGADDSPSVTLELANDTAPVGLDIDAYLNDKLTNDPTLRGTASDNVAVEKLELKIDDGPYVDITPSLENGQYSYDPGDLDPGSHRATIRATDDLAQSTVTHLDFIINSPPTPDAGGDREVDEGTTVSFDASASTDTEGPIYSYSWVSESGTTHDASVVSHTYADNGEYLATLTVTDTAGSQATKSVTVMVNNVPAEIGPVTDQETLEGQTVSFSTTFTDPGVLDTHTGTIDWRDGSPLEAAAIDEQAGSGTASGTHVYQDDGTYDVAVRVGDNDGAASTTQFQVAAVNQPPVVLTASDLRGSEGQELDFVGTFSDPGVLDTHTAEIQWGDGTSSVGQITTTDGRATVSASHVYSDNGNYTVAISVTDDSGGTGAGTASAIIANVAPSVSIDGPQVGNVGEELHFTVSATDPSPADMQSDYTYQLDWDGDASVDEVVVGLGTAVDVSHVFSAPGNRAVSVTATDKDGGIGPATEHRLTVTEDGLARIGGYVYVDVNNNGVKDAPEMVLPNVPITMRGYSSETVLTDTNGWYEFTHLPPGTCSIHQTQPAAFLDGKDTPGTPVLGKTGEDEFYDIQLESGMEATDYNFGERGLIPELISKRLFLASTPDGNELISEIVAVNGNAWFTFSANKDGELNVRLDSEVVDPLLELYTDNMAPVALSDGNHVLAGNVAESKSYILHVAGNASGEDLNAELSINPRQPVSDPTSPTSDNSALDVNQDGWISPIDALLVIRQLNSDGPGVTRILSGDDHYELDVNRDGHLSPIDALLVIGYLNNPSRAEGEGEWAPEAGDGESVDAADGAAPSTGQGTVEAEVSPAATKFYVVDSAAAATFRYAADGGENGQFAVADTVNDPRGITSTAAGDMVWIVDGEGKSVSKHHQAETLIDQWQAIGVQQPEGIATDGRDIWIVDAELDKVLRYAGATLLCLESIAPSDLFSLRPDNSSPSGIATDGETIWVTDDLADGVFVYTTGGKYVGQWALDSQNDKPSGITNDPSGGTDLWVVDRTDLLIYHYAAGTTLAGSTATADGTLALAAENVWPEGIADPPVLTTVTPADGSQVSVGSTLVISGSVMPGSNEAPISRVTVNDTPVEVTDASGNFFAAVSPTPGDNVFEIAATNTFEETVTTTLTLEAVQSTRDGLDFNILSDASGSFTPDYGRTAFNEDADVLYAEMAVQNAGQYVVNAPLLVGVANISDPTVNVRDFDGLTPEGIAYYDVSELMTGDTLAAGGLTQQSTISFYNPDRVPFTYELLILGQVNHDPVVTSVPDVEAIIDKPYAYAVTATDVDGDGLSFSLASGPANASIDAVTGELSWSPTSIDIGNHTVVLSVDDAVGGSTTQSYTLSVIDPPPNRPPVFTTQPVVDANATLQYTYPAQASDADDDPVTFSLVEGPLGITIHPNTGVMEWLPSSEDVGIETVVIQASDGRGGTTEQAFQVSVQGDVGNRRPVIVTDSIASVALGELYRYDVDAVDSDGDLLEYRLLEGPERMGIDCETGMVSWTQPKGFGAGLNFEGANDYAVIPDSPSLNPIGDYTLEFWVKPNAPGNATYVILDKRDGTNGVETAPFGVALYNTSAYPHALFWWVGDGNESYSPLVVSGFFEEEYGDWVHVALVMNDNTMRAYKNGTLQQSETYSGTRVGNSAMLQIGRRYDNKCYFNGTIDEVRLWNYARTSTEIATDLRQEVDSNCAELLGYWKFNEAEGCQIHDATDNGNDGWLGDTTQEKTHPTWVRSANSMNADVLGYSQDAVAFYDAEFVTEKWSLTTLRHGPYNNAVVHPMQQRGSGGNGGEYAYLSLGRPSANVGDYVGLVGFFARDGATYDPRVEGKVFSIDYAQDYVSLSKYSAAPRLALWQDGLLYWIALTNREGTSVNNVWNREILENLVASDFILVSPEEYGTIDGTPYGSMKPPAHPDFSAAGSSITFGFVTFGNNSEVGSSYKYRDIGLDNWSVNVNRTPFLKVSLHVNDPRGGYDTQVYELEVTHPSEIHGFTFEDMNENGIWDRPQTVLIGEYRYDTSTGAFIEEFGASGAGVFGPNGNLFKRQFRGIAEFDGVTGQFLSVFASEGLVNPMKLTFGPDGNLYVCELTRHSVLRFDGTSGEFLDTFATGVRGPYDLEFGPDGHLYVMSALYGDTWVHKFDGNTGARLERFAYAGPWYPRAMTFGPHGDLYVAERHKDRVVKFDGSTGQYLEDFVSQNSGGLDFPTDMSFGPDGRLYVFSYYTDNVLTYDAETGDYLGQFTAFEQDYSGAIVFPPRRSSAAPELGHPGWTVYLDENQNGRRDEWERWTQTEETGRYAFRSLGAGEYVVAEEPRAAWIHTTPPGRTHLIAVGRGDVTYNVDFGNCETSEIAENAEPSFTSSAPKGASVAGLFYYDANARDPDGDFLYFSLAVKPRGMTVDPERGIVVWVPTAEQVGEHPVVLAVDDGRGGVALQSFTITVRQLNSPPVIVSIPPSRAIVDTPFRYEVRALDADFDLLAFTLSGESDGMAVSDKGVITWTPDSSQIGEHTFAVSADDGFGSTVSQTVTVDALAEAPNHSPVITSVPRTTIHAGRTYRYRVAADDSDRDPLTFQLDTSPDGMMIGTSGLVTWSPPSSQLGVHDVRVITEDGRGGNDWQDFTITVGLTARNTAPRITSSPSGTATVGRQYRYDLNATDADHDPVTWYLDSGATGMLVDPQLGMLLWTPDLTQVGEQSVNITAVDGQGGMDSQTFTITVRGTNLPPSLSSVPPTQAYVDQGYTYLPHAWDGEGDTLAYSLTAAPEGMTIDPVGGLIRWTPQIHQVGSHVVQLHVEDGLGGHVDQPYTVVVADVVPNKPPLITSTPSFMATGDQLYEYWVTATDPELEDVLFSVAEGPTGMTIDPLSGHVTWTPEFSQHGQHRVTVEAVDERGAVGRQTFQLTAEFNLPPVIMFPRQTQLFAEQLYRYDVHAFDPNEDPITIELVQTPEGMTMDSLGRIRWRTTVADIGTHPLEIAVSDDHGETTVQQFDLSVVPDTRSPVVDLSVNRNPLLLDFESPEPDNTVTVAMRAVDNVAVATSGLFLDGTPIVVDNLGRANLEFDTPGLYGLLATATDTAGNVTEIHLKLDVIIPDLEAPHLAITSPAPGDEITGLLEIIGSVEDENLDYYSVSIMPALGGQVRDINTGTETVSDAVLGRFDPSSLPNDTYSLLVYAWDLSGNSSSIEMLINVDSQLKLGNFTVSFNDLLVDVTGIPISIARTYDSMNANSQDDLGYGWTLAYRDTNVRTSVPESGMEDILLYNAFYYDARVFVTLPDGERAGFRFEPTYSPLYEKMWRLSQMAGIPLTIPPIYVPRFVPNPGTTSQLSVESYELLMNDDGEFVEFSTGLPYNPTSPVFGQQFVLTTANGIKYQLDAESGDLERITDRNANTLTFTRSAVVSSAGPRVDFERDPRGRITAVIDPAGNRIEYAYDRLGNLVSVTDREGDTTELVYGLLSEPHYLTEIIDPLGRTGVRTEYDENGRLIKMIDADSQAIELTHDPENFLETVTDQLGNETAYVYDNAGNGVTEANAEGSITERTYDGHNNMLTETVFDGVEPAGFTTSFTYNARGDVLTETDPLGNTTYHTYDAYGNLLSTTDPLGHTTTNRYDSRGNLLSTTDPSGQVTSFTYDSAGNPLSIATGGNVTTFTYDAAGRGIQQTDAGGAVRQYTYDAAGNQLTETVSFTTSTGLSTIVTENEYDAQRAPHEIRHQGGRGGIDFVRIHL